MAQQNQTRPLAPVKVYPRSDVESAGFPPIAPKSTTRHKHASKCFVFFLVTFVVLAALALAFSLTVLRIEAPEFKIRNASVDNLKYDDNSTSTRVRGTLVGEVMLKNTNFGTFEHGNGAVNVSHGGDKDFGGGKVVIRQGRMRARETETAMASIEFAVSGEGEGKNNTLREEVGQGIVRLRSHGKVVGKISVLGFLKKNKAGVMDCTISLELSSSRIKDLYCK